MPKINTYNHTLSAQNTEVNFNDIPATSLRSRRYELTLEKSAPGITGTITIMRKKINTSVYAPWKDLVLGTNAIDLGLLDIDNNVILSYEITDSDVFITDVKVSVANLTGGTVKAILNAW